MKSFKIVITPNTKRNEFHFNIQRRVKSQVFKNRKKDFKNGYRKHKHDAY